MKKHRTIFLLLLISILSFLPDLAGSRGFLYGDNLSQRIPTLSFWKQEILKGQFPFWNPYILGGIPFFADLSNNVLAPTNIFYLLFSIPVALTLLVIFFISVSAVFTYLFVKQETKSEIAGLFSALTFAFSGSTIASVNDINSLQGIGFIPVVLYSAQQYINKSNRKTKLWLIITLAMQFISSHPQYSYYTWILVSIYLLLFLKGDNIKKIFSLGKIFLLVFSLISIQLLPFLELSNNAYRPKSLEFSTQNQLQLIELPSLFLANIYGSWREGSSWGPGSQLETGLANSEGYLGILPLLVSIYATFEVKGKEKKFWTITAFLSLLLSFGNLTPLYFIATKILPLFEKFRSPVRILIIYSFSLSILAGFGLSQIQKKLKT